MQLTSPTTGCLIALGSREAEELDDLHSRAQALVVAKTQSTLFSTRPTLETLKGLLVVWVWLSFCPPPGHLVGVAHELKLRTLCATLFKDWQVSRILGRRGL